MFLPTFPLLTNADTVSWAAAPARPRGMAGRPAGITPAAPARRPELPRTVRGAATFAPAPRSLHAFSRQGAPVSDKPSTSARAVATVGDLCGRGGQVGRSPACEGAWGRT